MTRTTKNTDTEAANRSTSRSTSSDRSDNGTEQCEGCKAHIDLTKSVLYKNGHIVGCYCCRWGSPI